MKLWIARDYNNGLYLYFDKPKCADEGYFYSLNGEMLIPHQLFPEITFENSPKKIKLEIIEE